MKKFILKTTAFVVFFALVVMSLSFVNRHFGRFKVGSENQILLIGHSHPECAFNDELIPGLVNFSESGDTYFYSYIKAKKFIEKNPQIDKLILGFTNNLIDQGMDEWIWGDMYLGYRFPKYAPFMEKEDLELLIEKNPQCVKQTIPVLSKTNINMIIQYRLDYTKVIGGYFYLERHKTDSLIASKAYEKQYYEDVTKLSLKNIEYLHKLIDFSEENGVKVFLLRSPMHDKTTCMQNEEVFQEIISSQFSEIEFLDFLKYPASNREFGDFDHLNYIGAERFSIWFASLLDGGLLEMKDKQTYIDEEINALVNSDAGI